MKKSEYYKRAEKYFYPYRFRYCLCVLIYAVGLFILFSSVGIFMRQVFYAAENSDPTVFRDTLLRLMLIVLNAGLSSCAPISFIYIEQQMQNEIRRDMVEAYINADEKIAEYYTAEDIMSRIGEDLPKVTDLYGYEMAGWVYEPILAGTISLVYLYFVNWRVAALCFFCAWGGSRLVMMYSKKRMHENKCITEYHGKILRTMSENLYGAEEIRTFGMQEVMQNRLEKHLQNMLSHNRLLARYQNFRSFFLRLFMDCIAVVAVIMTGGYLAEHGIIDFGDIMAAIPLLDQIWQMMTAFATKTDMILECDPNISRVFEIIDLPSQKAVDRDGEEILLDHVTFSYDGLVPTVKDISLKIPVHGTTAIIGESGSGKSTIAKLICGLYAPDCGTVSCPPASSISYMGAEQTLLSVPVKNNIALTRQPEMQRVTEASVKACADTFIHGKDGAYDYVPAQDSFSGGEIQRIAVARSIYHDADIMIFDEPTSALDPELSKSVADAIYELGKDHTVIIITHQIELIEHADCIILMNYGRTAAAGTYKELLLSCELFNTMREKQSGYQGLSQLDPRNSTAALHN